MIWDFNVPAPPSANLMWRHTARGTHKSKQYKDWLIDASWAMTEQIRWGSPSEQPITVIITHYPADGRHERRDLDNNIKPLCDLLEHCQLIANDRQIVTILANRGKRMQTHHLGVVVSEQGLEQTDLEADRLLAGQSS